MTRILLHLTALLLLVPASIVFAQDDGDEPAPTPDEVAETWLKEFNAGLDDLSVADKTQAAKKMVEIYLAEDVDEKTKKVIPKHLEKLAKDDDETVAMASIDALGALKSEDAAKKVLSILAKELKDKEPSVERYGACFRALKSLADESKGTVDALMKYFRYKNEDVINKALDAAAGYEKADGSLRKELLEEAIKFTLGAFNQYEGAGGDNNAKRKWNIIRTGAMAALDKLSGQKFKDPKEADGWFRKAKKEKDLWK